MTKNLASPIFLVLADALHLPFRSRSFDKAVSYSTIDHIPKDREKSIHEMARVTKVRGEITITVPNRLNLPYYLASKLLQATRLDVYEYECCFSPWELKRILLNCGLFPIQFDSEQIECLDIYAFSFILRKTESHQWRLLNLVNFALKSLQSVESLFPWSKYFGARIGYRSIKIIPKSRKNILKS